MRITKDTAWHRISQFPIPAVKDRPVCANCGKTRSVKKSYTDFRTAFIAHNKLPYDIWSYTGYGYFCCIKCAVAYANKAVQKLIDETENKIFSPKQQ